MANGTRLNRSPASWADKVVDLPSNRFIESVLKSEVSADVYRSFLHINTFGQLTFKNVVVPSKLVIPTLSKFATAKAFGLGIKDYEHGSIAIDQNYIEYKIDSGGHSLKFNGRLHSLNSCPAFVDTAGYSITYYRHGQIHRSDGPAAIWEDDESFYLYGNQVSRYRFNTKKFDSKTGAFIWEDFLGRLHSETSADPSYVGPDGKLQYHNHGLLHNDFMSAVVIHGEDFVSHQYWLYGRNVSAAEASRYSPETQEIRFFNELGELDRADGPACIKVSQDGSTHDFYYFKGKLHREDGPAVVHKVKDWPTVAEFWLHGNRHLNVGLNEESDSKIKEIKSAINLVGSIQKQGDTMSENTDGSNRRLTQLTTGAKHGLKKGAVKVVSDKASQAIVGFLPIGNNVVGERLVQITLLLAGAEVVERVPDAIATKVGLTEDRRQAFGSLCRHLGGETLGRDAVELVSQLAPLFADALSTLSAADITEAAESMVSEQNEEQEIEEERATTI